MSAVGSDPRVVAVAQLISNSITASEQASLQGFTYQQWMSHTAICLHVLGVSAAEVREAAVLLHVEASWAAS